MGIHLVSQLRFILRLEPEEDEFEQFHVHQEDRLLRKTVQGRKHFERDSTGSENGGVLRHREIFVKVQVGHQ